MSLTSKLFIILFLAGWLVFSSVQTALAELPPRPVPPTTTGSATQPAKGARLILQLPIDSPYDFSEDTWSQVQWQDKSGRWHNVDGWAGTPTFNPQTFMFEVEWWVDHEDFSSGPFRWYVSLGQVQYPQNLYSTPFKLPSAANEIKVVHILNDA